MISERLRDASQGKNHEVDPEEKSGETFRGSSHTSSQGEEDRPINIASLCSRDQCSSQPGRGTNNAHLPVMLRGSCIVDVRFVLCKCEKTSHSNKVVWYVHCSCAVRTMHMCENPPVMLHGTCTLRTAHLRHNLLFSKCVQFV
ncbi:hypothetical protein Q3G72_027001 [Acer saccharum]|nr:hypothetical protein Q3G72_027001 [Acer saccharum]